LLAYQQDEQHKINMTEIANIKTKYTNEKNYTIKQIRAKTQDAM